MAELTGYKRVNLRELIQVTGEGKTKKILSSFSCPLNLDVEDFIRNKAIEFSKQGYASTHLIFTSYQENVVLIGYFALANKSVTIKRTDLNCNWRRRLNRFAEYDGELNRYYVSLPLIGQLGKNYTNGYNQLITGDELLKMACDMIRETQLILSGKMAYLECEDIPKLVDFYKLNGFYPFAHRNMDREERGLANSEYLVQLLRYFDE